MTSIAGLLMQSSDVAFIVDGTGHIMDWNGSAEAVFGVSLPEALGRPCYEVLSIQTEDRQPLCGPHCPALSYFQHGKAFGGDVFIGQQRYKMGSFVLPGLFQEGTPKALVWLAPLGEKPKGPSSPSPLMVYTLGPLRIWSGGGPVTWHTWPRQQAALLLRLLLAWRGVLVHCGELITALWPDATQADGTARLKVLVRALRQYLEPHLDNGAESAYLVQEGEGYMLRTGPNLWVDVDKFQELLLSGNQALARKDSARAVQDYEAAIALYRGDFLQDHPYYDWLIAERERLREMALGALARVAALKAEIGDVHGAILSCQRALELDPVREEVHRELMSYLWRSGQRSAALRQYQACTMVLDREFGASPMPQTTSLYAHFLHR